MLVLVLCRVFDCWVRRIICVRLNPQPLGAPGESSCGNPRRKELPNAY